MPACPNCGSAIAYLQPTCGACRWGLTWAATPPPIKPPPPRSAPASVACPKCGSEQWTSNQKGFGAGKAIVGGLLTGGIGLLAGFLGSKKVILTCLRCGKQWRPGA